MKDTLTKYVSVAVFSIAAVHAAASAQQYSTPSGPSVAAFGIAGGMDRVAMLTAMLSLNASQQANAKAIFNEEDAASKPLLEQLRQASDALLSAQKAAAPDAEIDQLARTMAGISGEILAIDAKAQSRVYSQLSADQKQKLEQLPHSLFGVSAPLLPPGPVFVSASDRHE